MLLLYMTELQTINYSYQMTVKIYAAFHDYLQHTTAIVETTVIVE